MVFSFFLLVQRLCATEDYPNQGSLPCPAWSVRRQYPHVLTKTEPFLDHFWTIGSRHLLYRLNSDGRIILEVREASSRVVKISRFFCQCPSSIAHIVSRGQICYSARTMTPTRPFGYLVETMWLRIFSALSPDTAASKLLRLDWIEALQTPGCALCHTAQRKSQRYIEILLNEAVTDVDQRDIWRQARGLCHWHAWMATETPHSAGSLAILYADVLQHDLGHLAALITATPVIRRWRHSLGRRVQNWLRSWRQQRPCPVCRLWREQERLYLQVLLDDWQESELVQAFAASSGLCWWHTLHLVELGMQHTHLPAVLTAQQVHLQRVQDEWQEFVRKLDYLLARQPFGLLVV